MFRDWGVIENLWLPMVGDSDPIILRARWRHGRRKRPHPTLHHPRPYAGGDGGLRKGARWATQASPPNPTPPPPLRGGRWRFKKGGALGDASVPTQPYTTPAPTRG